MFWCLGGVSACFGLVSGLATVWWFGSLAGGACGFVHWCYCGGDLVVVVSV